MEKSLRAQTATEPTENIALKVAETNAQGLHNTEPHQKTALRVYAELSCDRLYRYRLVREWAEGPHLTFIMLNPSTADETTDDPTLRRCLGFAKQWGAGGLTIVNLYAYRATKPADLWTAHDPVGPENNRYLHEAAASGNTLVAAWGAQAEQDRVTEVLAIPGFERLTSIRTTKHGHPSHPLYLPQTLTPTPWPRTTPKLPR